jgi:AMMECR1 domain-containing protein
VHKAGRSAVFLPQVAPEQGWDVETMLSHLSLKAGLPKDAWREGARFEVFEAIVFGER